MKILETDFIGTGEVKGVRFTQLFRFKDLCLYHRSDGTFEIIKVRYQKAGKITIKGREIIYEEKERYPKGEEWGKYEWACNTIERAILRYNEQAKAMEYSIILTENELATIRIKTIK